MSVPDVVGVVESSAIHDPVLPVKPDEMSDPGTAVPPAKRY